MSPGNYSIASCRRTLDRLRALVASGLSPQQVVGEQVRIIGETICASTVPDFYVLRDADMPPHAFEAWCGKETVIEDMRGALAAAVAWPGSPDMPSPQRLSRTGTKERFVMVTPGGAATPATPWEPFWRARNLRHGLYGLFLSNSGRIGVLLASRGHNETPFEPRHLAFLGACARYVEAALDLPQGSHRDHSPSDRAQLRFDERGSVVAMSFGAPRILRDLAGGGPCASAAGRRIVEDANLALHPLQDHDRRGVSLVVGENGYGRFHLHISSLVGMDGRMEQLGTITRSVPTLLLRLRGALAVQASAREMQLLGALDGDATMRDAARALNIAPSTARTLAERLAARVGAAGMAAASDRLMELGLAADRTDP